MVGKLIRTGATIGATGLVVDGIHNIATKNYMLGTVELAIAAWAAIGTALNHRREKREQKLYDMFVQAQEGYHENQIFISLKNPNIHTSTTPESIQEVINADKLAKHLKQAKHSKLYDIVATSSKSLQQIVGSVDYLEKPKKDLYQSNQFFYK